MARFGVNVWVRLAFMTPDSYPGGAKAVDDHIGERISDLSRAVSDGFSRIERDNQRIEQRFDKMVTQSEFSATVERLDGQDKTIEEKVDRGLDDMRDELHSGLSRMSAQVTEGFDKVSADTKERNIRNRWFWGTGLTAIMIVNAIVFNIVGLLLP